VTDSAIATDIHQSLDVKLGLGTKFTLKLVILGEDQTDSIDVIVIPFLNLHVAVNAGFVKHFLCSASPNTVDISESYFALLIPW
jgi:hypothetical protein